ncbi:hypothetical protein BJY52DRAFT_1229256 [Lactarius psammicola]|nr:hypothetical protein BJY52DRAFT_1229256 [Lactarius psammicola]
MPASPSTSSSLARCSALKATQPGALEMERYHPGDVHLMHHGVTKQYKMHEGCWAMEYTRVSQAELGALRKMTTDKRDNEEGDVKRAEEDFKHEQEAEEVKQTNGGELHGRLEACKWEFTSGQSECYVMVGTFTRRG